MVRSPHIPPIQSLLAQLDEVAKDGDIQGYEISAITRRAASCIAHIDQMPSF